ncbi:hypothetical protein, partial [Paracoccus sp. (in: a-proteobacteria)]|uniref:hypothetical protein n=1 Tax=Paracoccus sp. TaxID=267 RepID=UPI0028A976F5
MAKNIRIFSAESSMARPFHAARGQSGQRGIGFDPQLGPGGPVGHRRLTGLRQGGDFVQRPLDIACIHRGIGTRQDCIRVTALARLDRTGTGLHAQEVPDGSQRALILG